ncbi:YheV family putative zinc ribbon protein [Denitrificimonas sp. JX-1]|uniref:YheV family putative zinc ribbon protein n=1 Tax=Denitrificimonas halotolerans TaxID=3098930 RepID=A0ABU5GPY5_9GAMM|nr:YheV family putative zinc ribbon protein [Denitrificimonas sp. JX-1]MDY7218415.1 YheV family putative zinc ribbon protein [Denitrificimonas sp. JX-1]
MTTPSKSEIKKRFIAGAVCPACQAMDGIRMWEVEDIPHRDCVHCGYSDTLNADGNVVPNEIPTRVNTSALHTNKIQKGQALQFFPNPKLKK